jgi:hypothetical protein
MGMLVGCKFYLNGWQLILMYCIKKLIIVDTKVLRSGWPVILSHGCQIRCLFEMGPNKKYRIQKSALNIVAFGRE